MADFTPSWTNWTDPGPFRFWAQKVLPLMYDDSLSYYEVLCKVVDYLNTTITNVAALGGNVEGLRDAYEQLQQYVNDYFDNLDVQQEINDKLDEMARTGELTVLIEPFILQQISADVTRWLEEYIRPTTPLIDSGLTTSGAGADARVTGFFRAATLQPDTENLLKFNFFTRSMGGTASGVQVYNGMLLNGTPGSGAYNLSDPVELPAGDYTFGVMVPTGASGAQLQIRKWDGSADAGSLGQSNSSGSFTLEEATQVYCRIKTYGNAFTNVLWQPYLVAGGNSPAYYVKGQTAADLIARGMADHAWKTDAILSSNTDLNTVTTSGIYRGGAGSTYTNLPEDAAGSAWLMFVIEQTTSDVVVQMLIKYAQTSGDMFAIYTRFLSGSPATWKAWDTGYSKDLLINVWRTDGIIPGGTDLDTILTPGIYRGGQGQTYTNAPLSGVGFILFVIGQKDSTTVTTQLFITNNYGNNEQYSYYSRFYSGSPATWKDWTTNYTPVESLAAGADLNDAVRTGTYGFSANVEYINMPEDMPASYRKMLYVFHRIGTSYVTQMLIGYLENNTMLFYIRARSGSPATWQPWTKFYNSADLEAFIISQSDNTSMTFTPAAITAGPANVGEALRIMTYNVAKWNKDTSTFLTDEKIFNVREFLSDTQPAIVCTQEDGPIDATSGSRPSATWIFNPAIPQHYGAGQCCIHSRAAALENVGVVWMQSTRPIRAAVYTINNKRVLICSVHPLANKDSTGSSSVESIAERLTEYTQLFNWVMGRVQLPLYPNNVMTSAPAWDACIICGDFNTITTDDKGNLATLAGADGFTMANGGYLGWIETEVNQNGRKALDNVIVKGCVINGFKSYQSKYEELWSDHYPVICDLTVL